jgi:riboflavin synthase
MFTGLIESMGRVLALRRAAGGGILRVEHDLPGEPLVQGESIAVDGICLTVVRMGGGWFEADLSAETLARTNLGGTRPGRRVNLERALAVGERLGGHLVQGHVDGTGVWEGSRPAGEGHDARIRAPEELVPFLLPKGSVAVDGISLTVASLAGPLFTVALIPHTWEATTLKDRRPGDRVTLESDMVVRAVVTTLQRLIEEGALGTGTGRGQGRVSGKKPVE